MVGGGIVGLSVAWGLARAGRPVELHEAGRCAEASTWAAAGMLAPWGESGQDGPFFRLARHSGERYPDFCAQLEEVSGVGVAYSSSGSCMVAESEAEAEDLQAQAERASGAGVPCEWWGEAEVLGRLPSLRAGTQCGALHFPEDAHVDNRALGVAMTVALRRAGVRIYEGSSVQEIVARSGRVRGVVTEDGSTRPATRVVVAAGAWSGTLRGLPRPIPVEPVRGEMIALEAPGLLPTILHSSGMYAIQRGSRVLVGATMERVGFDLDLTDAARSHLRKAAARLVPALGAAPLREQWAGLRPGTPDDLPILGPDPDVQGLIYACGHFRNGILLAPAMVEWAETEMSRLANEPGLQDCFSVRRFGRRH